MLCSPASLLSVVALLAAPFTFARTVPHINTFRSIERDHPESRGLLLDPTCNQIKASISSASAVYAPGTVQYLSDMAHFAASSTQYAACSVEPGSSADVAVIMRILSNCTTPFAIKSGGHTTVPGASSTTGVLISLVRFNTITVASDMQSVQFGTGLIWDDVYAKIVPMGINVVGGRVSGVGVGGFTLGGGFSWLTNLHGLTIDTVLAFEVVIPSGEILQVSATSNSDLFWGMKGGLNNFGVVTKITLKSFPQGQVWGGDIIYDGLHYVTLTNLTAVFQATNTDPNANIIPTYDILATAQIFSLSIFYNGPEPPAGLFDGFLAVTALSKNVKTRSFGDLVTSAPSNATANLRGAFSSVSLQNLSLNVLTVIKQQAVLYGTTALLGAGVFVSYDVEPFLTSWPSKAPSTNSSAWPHDNYLSPLNLYFAWPLGLSDDIFYNALAKTKQAIINAALAEGQNLSPLYTYPNYALSTDSLESIYGPNVPALKALAAKYDPGKVMTRTGGFIFQK
ncbi:FAD-binding domain-containing protein [Clavulina sp. PMI_390]|nr:FAD-binding domain-containing protein [Clavulina sp. PMI_390]